MCSMDAIGPDDTGGGGAPPAPPPAGGGAAHHCPSRRGRGSDFFVGARPPLAPDCETGAPCSVLPRACAGRARLGVQPPTDSSPFPRREGGRGMGRPPLAPNGVLSTPRHRGLLAPARRSR